MPAEPTFDRYREFKLGQHNRCLVRARHFRHLPGYHAQCLESARLVRTTLAADYHAEYPTHSYRKPEMAGRFF